MFSWPENVYQDRRSRARVWDPFGNDLLRSYRGGSAAHTRRSSRSKKVRKGFANTAPVHVMILPWRATAAGSDLPRVPIGSSVPRTTRRRFLLLLRSTSRSVHSDFPLSPFTLFLCKNYGPPSFVARTPFVYVAFYNCSRQPTVTLTYLCPIRSFFSFFDTCFALTWKYNSGLCITK